MIKGSVEPMGWGGRRGTHNLGTLEPAVTPKRKVDARTAVPVALSDHRRRLEHFPWGSEAQRRAVDFRIVDRAKHRQAVGHFRCRDSGAELVGLARSARRTRVGTANGGICERDLKRVE